jgi:hypothetical protein
VLYIFTVNYTFLAVAKQDLLTEDSHLTFHILWEIGNETSKTFPRPGHLEMPVTQHKKLICMRKYGIHKIEA